MHIWVLHMIDRLRIITVLAALFIPVQASAIGETAEGFMDFAMSRCIGPLENVKPADKSDMKLSARSAALVPGLSNSALVWETKDGFFFMSIDLHATFDRCTIGLRDPDLRKVEAHHLVVIEDFKAQLAQWIADAKYTVEKQVEGDGRYEVKLESTIWREPRIEVVFVSDINLGRLHIYVQEINKEA